MGSRHASVRIGKASYHKWQVPWPTFGRPASLLQDPGEGPAGSLVRSGQVPSSATGSGGFAAGSIGVRLGLAAGSVSSGAKRPRLLVKIQMPPWVPVGVLRVPTRASLSSAAGSSGLRWVLPQAPPRFDSANTFVGRRCLQRINPCGRFRPLPVVLRVLRWAPGGIRWDSGRFQR